MENNSIVEKKDKTALLARLYDFAINGIPLISEPVNELVAPYIDKYGYSDKAIKKFVDNQRLKCVGTGFLTGLGGLLTLPVAVSADLASGLYVELRMIAGIAIIRRFNPQEDAVRTMVYLCLIGNACSEILQRAGIEIGEKLVAKKLLPLLSRNVTSSINKKVSFRLLTKSGNKGIINAGKLVPVVGGLIGGGFNWFEVSIIAKQAKKMFV